MSFFQYRAANSQQCFMVVAAEGFTSQTGTYTRTWERLCWQKRLLLTTLHGVNRVFWSLQAFSGEKWVCVEEASFVFWWKWLFGFVFFFLYFILRNCFWEEKDLCLVLYLVMGMTQETTVEKHILDM